MKPLPFVVCATSLAVSCLTAAGEDHVSGKFTVKGKTTEFHHVYAFWKPRLMDESKVDLYVLLSDEAVSADTLPKDDEGVSKMAMLVRDDKIHALELHFDGGTNKLFEGEQGAVYHLGLAMARMGEGGAFQYSPSGKASAVQAGKASAKMEDWSCDAAFQVAIPARP